MALGSSSPCLDPMCWEVCKSVMLQILRDSAGSQACCVMGHGREVPPGATEPSTSDSHSITKARVSMLCLGFCQGAQDTLLYALPPLGAPDLGKRLSWRQSHLFQALPAAAQGNISICAAGRMGCSSIFHGLGHPMAQQH